MYVGSMPLKMSVSSTARHRVNFKLLIFLASTNRLADFVALSHKIAYGDVQRRCVVVIAGRRPDIETSLLLHLLRNERKHKRAIYARRWFAAAQIMR